MIVRTSTGDHPAAKLNDKNIYLEGEEVPLSSVTVVSDNETLYDIMGLQTYASRGEIKSQYRKLSKLTHPDKGGDPAAQELLGGAYNVLNSPKQKATYDRDLARGYTDEDLNRQRMKDWQEEEARIWRDHGGKIIAGRIFILAVIGWGAYKVIT